MIGKDISIINDMYCQIILQDKKVNKKKDLTGGFEHGGHAEWKRCRKPGGYMGTRTGFSKNSFEKKEDPIVLDMQSKGTKSAQSDPQASPEAPGQGGLRLQAYPIESLSPRD